MKVRDTKVDRRGFTLFELCIVLALLGILFTVTASFSMLLKGIVSESKEKYEFSKDFAELKALVCEWISENDVQGSVFLTDEAGALTAIGNDAERTVCFADGILSLDGERTADTDTLEDVVFSANGRLLKCVAYRNGGDGERMESCFVYSLRCGSVAQEASDDA